MSPQSGDGAYGLATTLGRQGHDDAARAMFDEAAKLYAKAKSQTGLRKIDIGRAGLLQAQATQLSASATIKLYQDALAAYPRNVYIRVGLARALQDAGQTQEASAVIAKGTELAPSDRQALEAVASASRLGPQPDRVQAEINAARRSSLMNFYKGGNGRADIAAGSQAAAKGSP